VSFRCTLWRCDFTFPATLLPFGGSPNHLSLPEFNPILFRSGLPLVNPWPNAPNDCEVFPPDAKPQQMCLSRTFHSLLLRPQSSLSLLGFAAVLDAPVSGILRCLFHKGAPIGSRSLIEFDVLDASSSRCVSPLFPPQPIALGPSLILTSLAPSGISIRRPFFVSSSTSQLPFVLRL